MNNQGGSCCGPTADGPTEPTESAKPATSTSRAVDARVTEHNLTPAQSGTSGLLGAVRRLFGRVPA